MIGIENTGERILLDKETPLMIARHFSAYKFAKDYASGKKVLDIGCGEGYGTYYLSEFAKDSIGIDYDAKIVDYAKSKYRRDNLTFYVVDAKGLEAFKERFDVICSFQVIEHIRNAEMFLENISNLMNDDAIFICSTPNRYDASLNRETPLNRFHVKEYLLDEYRTLLGKYFGKIDMFGLKRTRKLNFYRRLKKIGIFHFFPQNWDPVKRFYRQIDCRDFQIVKGRLHTALDFIAVCRK